MLHADGCQCGCCDAGTASSGTSPAFRVARVRIDACRSPQATEEGGGHVSGCEQTGRTRAGPGAAAGGGGKPTGHAGSPRPPKQGCVTWAGRRTGRAGVRPGRRGTEAPCIPCLCTRRSAADPAIRRPIPAGRVGRPSSPISTRRGTDSGLVAGLLGERGADLLGVGSGAARRSPGPSASAPACHLPGMAGDAAGLKASQATLRLRAMRGRGPTASWMTAISSPRFHHRPPPPT